MQGYGATLASFGPFSALYFLFYEKVWLCLCFFAAALFGIRGMAAVWVGLQLKVLAHTLSSTPEPQPLSFLWSLVTCVLCAVHKAPWLL